jgi:phosphoglycolate phosphatase-like HAD superfamily hydrolase
MKVRFTSLFALLLFSISSFAQLSDPLPSWNEGPAKKSIIDFVNQVSQTTSANFVAVSDRIAVFDNDGTLWSEQPIYFQFAFALDQVKALAPGHPEWKGQRPFQAILKGDFRAALAGGEKSAAALIAAAHSDMSTDEFEKSVQSWATRAQHPLIKRRYTELVFQPMLEVLELLRRHEFTVYIISGSGIDFLRVLSPALYGIPPEHVIGSVSQSRFEIKKGIPRLMKLPNIDFIDDGPGKPVGIHQFIGRRPILAFGNSDGDLEMLQWTTSQPGSHLGLILHHTDADREWAYDRKSTVGKLNRALAAAPENGWTVIDMKKDWKVIFPFQKQIPKTIGSSTQ